MTELELPVLPGSLTDYFHITVLLVPGIIMLGGPSSFVVKGTRHDQSHGPFYRVEVEDAIATFGNNAEALHMAGFVARMATAARRLVGRDACEMTAYF